MGNMFESLSKQVEGEEYDEAADKMDSILSKADGDGKDWIVQQDAVDYISGYATSLIEYLRSLD